MYTSNEAKEGKVKMKFLILFVILSIINVIFSTVRSIVTVKGGKNIAAILSGGYFAFYNIMLIYTVADFPMWQKCLITFVCNVIGVWLVKYFEEKARKDKLWKIEATVLSYDRAYVCDSLKSAGLSYNYIEGVGKYNIVNIFCETQAQSARAREILSYYNAKYFVSETKSL